MRNGNGSKNSNIGFFVDFFSILFCPLEVETRDLTLLYAMLLFILLYTVVATMTFISVKPSISPSNLAQNANPGRVLKTARAEDSKTPQK